MLYDTIEWNLQGKTHYWKCVLYFEMRCRHNTPTLALSKLQKIQQIKKKIKACPKANLYSYTMPDGLA